MVSISTLHESEVSSMRYSRLDAKPEVSVVVCHHVGLLLYGFLDSIRKSTGVTFEIIIVTSDEKIATDGITDCIVAHSTAMPAEKRNIGSRIANGSLLAFFDDDVEVASDTLFELKRALTTDIHMVYGKLWNMEFKHRFDEAGSYLTRTGFLWSRAGQHDEDKGQYDVPELVLSGKSASCMIRKLTFDKIGGFDEDFGILGEETDLAWRVWLSGKQVLYEPKAVGYHAFNTKFKPKEKYYTSSRVHFNGCRNYITMLIKNLETSNLWRILPLHILIWTTAGLAMIITGRWRAGANILRGLFYVFRNLGSIIAKREIVQRRRSVTDLQIWPSIYRPSPRGYYTQRFTRYLTSGLHG